MGRKKTPTTSSAEPAAMGALGAAFASLGFTASAESPEPEEASGLAEEPGSPFGARRIVVRREKKGRRGKTVTVIDGLVGDLAPLARDLKRELGCGAGVEGDLLVLQGDHIERVAQSLERRGASDVRR